MNETKMLEGRAAAAAERVESVTASIESAEEEIERLEAELALFRDPRHEPKRSAFEIRSLLESRRRWLDGQRGELRAAERVVAKTQGELEEARQRDREAAGYAEAQGIPPDLAAAELAQRRRAAGLDPQERDARRMSAAEFREHAARVHGIGPETLG